MKSKINRYISVIVAIAMAFGSYFNVAASNVAQTANAVYVSTTGSGTTCTQSVPCSLTTGLGKLAAGYTLFLAPGNYNTMLRITKSGTASQPIKVTGAAKFTSVVISGSYVEVYGLEVAGAVEHGVLILGKHIRFSDFLVHDNVTENRSGSACISTSGGGWASGVKVERGSEDVFISNGTTYNNCGEGLAATMALNVTVSNVTSYDNFSVNFYVDNSKNVRFQNNFAYCTPNTNYYRSGQPASGFLIGEEYYDGWGGQLGGITIVNNISYGCKGINFYGVESGVTNGGLVGALIAHNTIWNVYGGGRAISISTQPYNQGIVIANNIAGGAISPANAVVSNNQSTAVFAVTPTYSPASFKLASNSPGINAGSTSIGVSTDYSGSSRDSKPDVGAWEYAGSLPTVTPVSVTLTATATSAPAAVTPTSQSTSVPATITPASSPTPMPSGQNKVDIRIASGSDDVEEGSNGSMYLDSTDLEIVYDINVQTVGLRFTGVNIPQGAVIASAFVQFKVDETSSQSISLQVQGEASANAPAFINTARNLSSRPRTANSIAWLPSPWTNVGTRGTDQATPNLAPVIQEIVNQPGWASGNSLVLIMTGPAGKRVAEAFEGDAAGAPLLHIEYNGNSAPLPNTPTPTVTIVPTGSAATATPTSTAIAPLPSATPTQVQATTVPTGGNSGVNIRIASGNDDVEEYSSGWPYLNSTDLELVYDINSQVVGLRFVGVNVPKGAVITNAYVQFKVDETSSQTISLKIQGEANANAPAFTTKTRNVSSRVRTTSAVTWSPAPWTKVGMISADQATPNLAPIIQEIISQSAWAPGNSLVILITGTTGKRVAKAFEGDAAGAPLLHIEYNGDASSASNPGGSTALNLPVGTPTIAAATSTATLPLPSPTMPAATSQSIIATETLQPTQTPLPANTTAVTETATATAIATETPSPVPSPTNTPTAMPLAPTDVLLSSTALDENLPSNTLVGSLSATDADSVDAFTYSLVDTPVCAGPNNAAFQISGNSLNSVSPFDYETQNSLTICIRVTDSSALSFDKQYIILVNNINELPAIGSDGGGDVASLNLTENTPNITTLTATDPDAGTIYAYSIAGGTDADDFLIDGLSGVITFAVAPDFESPADVDANNVYEVIVQVADGLGGADSQTITVTVNAVNDNTPLITSDGGGETAALTIAENTAAVTDVNATDADLPTETLNYSISGGADSGKFSMDGSSGTLTFANAPDFEAPADANGDNVYEVTVQVSDGSFTDTQTISVSVTSVNDNDPLIKYDEKKDDDGNNDNKILNINVPENEKAVIDLDAADADLPAETLTFSILSGVDAPLFHIVPETGVLTFINARDFESPADAGLDNVYDITIQVTDGSRSTTQDVAVKITPLNDNTPSITSNGGGGTAAVSIAENTTAVTVVNAKDADLPAETLSFSISGGADAALFTIASGTGALTFIAPPDFETSLDADLNNAYEVIVQVSDGNGQTSKQVIVVTITDVDDTFPPQP
ncbi:MAG: cadherin repeat domain-containing protein [Chloroflexi bacterium]|nr:cadherin repeat domain-containing protein [Chloroflexota bacterium]